MPHPLTNLFDYFLTYLPPPALLEPRFLRLHAQIQRLMGVMHVERQQYDDALQSYSKMNQIAEQLGEPYFLTQKASTEAAFPCHPEPQRRISLDRQREASQPSAGPSCPVPARQLARLRPLTSSSHPGTIAPSVDAY